MYAQGIVHTTGMVPSLKVALGWNPWPALKHYMLGKTSRPHFVSLYLPRPASVLCNGMATMQRTLLSLDEKVEIADCSKLF